MQRDKIAEYENVATGVRYRCVVSKASVLCFLEGIQLGVGTHIDDTVSDGGCCVDTIGHFVLCQNSV